MSPPEPRAQQGHPKLPKLALWAPTATAMGVFSPEECARIRAMGGAEQAGGIADEGRAGYRDSRVRWLRPSADSEWVFRRALDVVATENRRSYRAEIAGFTEPLQIAEYGPGQHYDWHLDFAAGAYSTRKLSFVVQLTDPATYEGGALEVMISREAVAIPREQGSLTIFPSFLLHRVCAVTRGSRHSLVGWIGGPHWR